MKRGLNFEERKEAEQELKKKISTRYLVSLKDYSDELKEKRGKKVISPSFLKEFKEFGKIERIYEYIPTFLLDVDQEEEFLAYIERPDLQEILDSFEKDSLVSIPEPKESQERRKKFWNLEMVEAYKGQRWTKGSGAEVAVVDTGADYKHKEIKENFPPGNRGYNVIEDSDDPLDDNGHGTHCSGIVAGDEVGIAPAVTLKAVKFLNQWGFGTLADAIEAIDWCIDEGVDITSNSWGSPYYSAALKQIFDVAEEKGILSIAAAGNSGRRSPEYPAQYDSVIATPAVDKNEKKAWFSTLSEENEISAPGVDIYSSIPNDSYREASGTSMSCPHVAGGAALVKALHKGKAEKIRQNLGEYAKKLGEEEEYGKGLLQIEKTLIGYY